MQPTRLVMQGFRGELEKLALTLTESRIDQMADAMFARLRGGGVDQSTALQMANGFKEKSTALLAGANTPAAVEGLRSELRKSMQAVEEFAPVHRRAKIDKKTGELGYKAVQQQIPRVSGPLTNKFRSFMGMEDLPGFAGEKRLGGALGEINSAMHSDPKYLERQGQEILRQRGRQNLMRGAQQEFGKLQAASRGGVREMGGAVTSAAKRGFQSLPGWGKALTGLGALVGAKQLMPEQKPKRVTLELGS